MSRIGWHRFLLVLALVPFGFSVSNAAASLQRFEFSQIQMGTLFRLVFYASDPTLAEEARTAAFRRIEELEQILSDYRPESEVMQVCQGAYEQPRVVSRDLFSMLSESLKYSELSDGAFDVTVKPLVKLWKEAVTSGQLPDPEALQEAKKLTGYRNVLLNSRTGSVRFRKPGVSLDFGGIAKGYTADEALRQLESRGIDRALIDAGGDLRLGAPPPDAAGWSVRLGAGMTGEEPMILHDLAVATSSGEYQSVEIGGIRYSHIVNPKTGLGVQDSKSVTVMAPDAVTADALATTLSVLDSTEGMRLIESLPGVEARIEVVSGTEVRILFSSRFPR